MGWTGHTQSGFLTPLAQTWKYVSDVFVNGLSPLVVLVSYLLTNSKLSPGFLTEKKIHRSFKYFLEKPPPPLILTSSECHQVADWI